MDGMPVPTNSDANPVARTLALDGKWYSFDEFVQLYGPAEAQNQWAHLRTESHRCGVLLAPTMIAEPTLRQAMQLYPFTQTSTPDVMSAQQDAGHHQPEPNAT